MSVTLWPLVGEAGEADPTVIAVLEATTLNDEEVLVLAAKLASPEKLAVTECVPTAP